MNNKFLNYFSLTIAVIGAVNWGLIGFFDLNLVSLLFGSVSVGRFSPVRVGLKTPISVNLKSPMHHVCY